MSYATPTEISRLCEIGEEFDKAFAKVLKYCLGMDKNERDNDNGYQALRSVCKSLDRQRNSLLIRFSIRQQNDANENFIPYYLKSL